MSGAGDPDGELVVLAGEYVLGTLCREDAVQLEREAGTDPAVADAIASWERQLSPLLRAVPAVAPPAALWPRIEASLPGAAADAAPDVIPLATRPPAPASSGSVARWRGAAAAGFLLAAAVAGIAILRQPPAAIPVAVLSPLGSRQAAFVIEAHRDGSVAILPMSPAPVPDGRDLELWSLVTGATVPHPIGLLPVAGLRLTADRLPSGPAQILVSLEPRGGSPTGLPTGPILYGAPLSPRRL